MDHLLDLSGKVAIVTGASSGIGRATVHALCRAGMNVVAFARRGDRLEALAQEIGAQCLSVVGDINDSHAVSQLIPAAVDSFGQCDVVINNAAAFAVGPIETLDAEQIRNLARTNVESAYHVAFEAIRYFKQQGHGDLVNLSSISGTKVARAAPVEPA